jgi:hypothetical protein
MTVPDSGTPAEGWPDDAGEEADAELADSAWAACPYCGEEVEILLDPGGGSIQEYVEDCEVCCRPCQVRVSLDASGHAHVSLSTLDET